MPEYIYIYIYIYILADISAFIDKSYIKHSNNNNSVLLCLHNGVHVHGYVIGVCRRIEYSVQLILHT